MIKHLLFLLLTLITSVAFTQNNYQDVVYLKNGSIIRGVIIEQVPSESIKIETADRSVFVYKMEEIAKLAKEPFQKREGEDQSGNGGLKPGYRGIVESGYQIGVGDFGMSALRLNIINGYQFNPYFSMGLGTGLRYYLDEDDALVPLFMDLRVNYMDNKVSPYLAVGVGYSFDASDGFQGVGLLFNPSTGVSFKLSDKSAMNVGLGYEMQRMKVLTYNFSYYGPYANYNYYTVTQTVSAISVNVGISF